MLTHLTIKNYALIDELEVDFTSGFSVITGETGAGKSILLGGLSLVLGKRADLSVIKDTSKKCIVEAVFNISNYNLQAVFDNNDIDYDVISHVRREILPSGKSRAFINDTPVLLDVMHQISSALIDIHSQHQTLKLSEVDFQMNLLDSLSGNFDILNIFSNKLKTFRALNIELQQLNQNALTLAKEYDYNLFLLNELRTVNLESLTLSDLETEYKDLNNAEELSLLISEAKEILDVENYGVVSNLNKLKFKLNKLSSLSDAFNELRSRVESTFIELDDLSSELESKQDHFSSNPKRLDELGSLLTSINNLLHKHQSSTIKELILVRDQLENSVEQTSNSENLIKQCEKNIESVNIELKSLSEELDKNRQAIIPNLINRLKEILSNLGMTNARFKISIIPQDSFNDFGNSKLEFHFSANKGSNFGTLDKVASGGELSRIMLAVKSILSTYKRLPTIMFDEIDSGVSGEVSDKMGNIMQEMSQHMQVFAITHLPQIAAKGKSHFKVFKYDEDEITKTQLKPLIKNERIQEIAQMLAGSNISNSAVEHAKQLLN